MNEGTRRKLEQVVARREGAMRENGIRDRYGMCLDCGQAIDTYDLDQVLHHQELDHKALWRH